MYLDPIIRERIDQKQQTLNSFRPLPQSAVEKLKNHLSMEMTYNSNAIEGNTLTLKETFLIINEGVTVKGKPLKDHLEAKDHDSALRYLYEMVEGEHHEPITEQLIRSLHQLVTYTTDRDWAGVYRNSNVIITGAAHQPPDALIVPDLMRDLLLWLKSNGSNFSIVELAALFHHKLVHIHPFFDGNGRTSRLLMNVLLMQHGFPLTIILKNDRKKYYRALASADKGDFAPITLFIAQAVERTLDIYLKTLTPMTEPRESFLPLSEIAKQTPYSAKYLNLLVRKGKIAAHKEGRIWMSSVDAVNTYIENRERQV